MKPIDQNLQYDFNFQQFTVLPNEITVLPVSLNPCHEKYSLAPGKLNMIARESEKLLILLSEA